MAELTPQFSSNRMLREYVEKLYLPSLESFKERTKNKAAKSKSLYELKKTIRENFSKIQFGQLDEDIRRRYDANVHIDCVMMANSIPGQPVVNAFNKGLEAYKEHGFEKEYELHHQGGSIGYEGFSKRPPT